MSYYDFANQRAKPKKSKRGLFLLTGVAALIAVVVWLLPHHHMTQPVAVHHATHKVAHKAAPSQALKLPPAPVAKLHSTQAAAKSTPAVIAKQAQPTTPQLEFYQMLKSPETAAALGKQQYNLQVAALASPTAAQQVVSTLKRHAFSAHIVTNSNGSNTHWNRVVLGPYNNAADAKLVQKKLERLGQRGVLLISNKK
jgi:cell division protein FtsN